LSNNLVQNKNLVDSGHGVIVALSLLLLEGLRKTKKKKVKSEQLVFRSKFEPSTSQTDTNLKRYH
jgi:hypothetical protein